MNISKILLSSLIVLSPLSFFAMMDSSTIEAEQKNETDALLNLDLSNDEKNYQTLEIFQKTEEKIALIEQQKAEDQKKKEILEKACMFTLFWNEKRVDDGRTGTELEPERALHYLTKIYENKYESLYPLIQAAQNPVEANDKKIHEILQYLEETQVKGIRKECLIECLCLPITAIGEAASMCSIL